MTLSALDIRDFIREEIAQRKTTQILKCHPTIVSKEIDRNKSKFKIFVLFFKGPFAIEHRILFCTVTWNHVNKNDGLDFSLSISTRFRTSKTGLSLQ